MAGNTNATGRLLSGRTGWVVRVSKFVAGTLTQEYQWTPGSPGPLAAPFVFEYDGNGDCVSFSAGLTADQPWPDQTRLIEIWKGTDTGQPRVWLGVNKATVGGRTPQEKKYTLNAVGLSAIDASGEATAFKALSGIIASGIVNMGSYVIPAAANGETWGSLLGRTVETYPSAAWGVRPEGVRVLGQPADGVPVTWAASSCTGLQSSGYQEQDYLSELVFDPGDNFGVYRMTRSDLPTLAARKVGTFSPSPVFLNPVSTIQFTTFSGVAGSAGSVSGSSSPVNISISGSDPSSAPALSFQTYSYGGAGSGLDAFTALVQAQINSTATAAGSSIYPRMRYTVAYWYGGASARVIYYGSANLDTAATITLQYDAAPEMLKQGGYLKGLLEIFPRGGSVNITFTDPLAKYTFRQPNYSGLVYPPGWTKPFASDPTFQGDIDGVHVIGPLQVTGLPLPGGGTVDQYAANIRVTWDKDRLFTEFQTAARQTGAA